VTAGGPGQLSHDVLDGRCKALAVYRRTLSGVLYLLARMGALGGPHVQKLVDWLRSRPHDSSTYHILSALLVALQPPSRTTSASSNPFASSSINTSTDYRTSLLGDRALASHMRSALSPGSAGWSEPALKAALGLQWALFATDARRADAALEHVQGYTTDEVEALVWAGAQGGAFTYLTRLVRRASPATFEAEEEMGVPVAGEHEAAPEAPEPEFVPVFLDALDVLVRTLIRHASSELRKIKQRQEDIVLASVRADRSVRFSRSAGPSSTSYPPAHTDGAPPRNDIAALFQLIGALYAALPSERALQFWGAQPLASASDPSSDALAAAVVLETVSPKLPAFVQWSTWSTQAADADALASLCGMLAGLANGPHCAELAYNFVAHGAGEAFSGATGAVGTASSAPAVSWTALFGMLEAWATALSAPKPAPPPLPNAFGASSSLSRSQGQQAASLVLGPKDVRLAQAFLRLLASVVSHSVDARKAVAGHGAFRAIPVLVTLLPLGVPLELKGAIFGALAAFCAPGAGSAGAEICRAVWGLMERMEVISLRPAGTSAAGVRGVEVELEEVEAPYRLYPATIPFLRLLATLVHTPRRVRFATRLLDLEPASPLPDQLGAPYRTPGLGPFVAFVVDAVFAQIAQREYMRSSDRWRMNDLCLCFVERCLAAYDLSALLALADSGPLTPELLQPFVTHPGHDVLKRILSNTPLSTLILSYVADGVDGFDRGFAREEPLFHSTIVRVLRIVLRVLEIQDAFLDVLVPLLAELDRTGAASPRSAFTPLDQALSFTPQHAPALAAYAAFPEHPELALLSVQITHRLSRSPAFTDLAAAIERSADSERILAAYVRILDADSAQEIADAEALADDHTGAGAPDPDDGLDLAQATRVAALDLLLDGTAPSLSKPHLAHFLLFGASRAETVEDPQALGAQLAGIHILIETLVDGVPRLDRVRSTEEEEDDALEPLFSTLPALAERQLRVLHQLCTHARTAEFVSRYLRAREDFVARQLAVIPARAPALAINEGEPFVDVGYSDGTRMRTTAPALGAFLRYRALVLELAALELHTQTARGHSRGVPELIRLLFTLDEESDTGTDELIPVLDESFKPFRELGQAHLRIIAQAHALDFDWADSLAVAPVELTLLRGLRLDACMCLDAAGCEVVDQGALLALLASARRMLQQQGRVATQVDAEALSVEVAYVLESCAVENHRRELAHAQEAGFAAWRRVLDVALFKAFDQLAPSAREGVLFDVLHVLPRLIRAEHVAPTTRALLAEAVVSCVAKLRDDRAQRAATNDGIADTLPAERLHSLLRALVACVLDPSQGALVRGNLYAALVDYLQLVHEPVASETESLPIRALSGSGIHSLRKGSLAVLKEVFGRLLNVVAGDALDGAEVWKTVAFVLLDALVDIAGSDLSNAALTTLVRTGMLANFVQAIRRDDQRLQAVLVPDPGKFMILLLNIMLMNLQMI
jgi:nuclear pore complex protein Nup205